MDQVHHGDNIVAIHKLGNRHNSGGQKVSAMELGSDELKLYFGWPGVGWHGGELTKMVLYS
jgi:hypothetical protein